MLEPKLWGPFMWYLLHLVSYTFQSTNHHYYQRFFNKVSDIFPCDHCQKHYQQHLNKYPPQTDSQESLAEWLVDIHNRVNKFRNIPTYTPEESRNLYYNDNGEVPVNHTYLVQLFLIIKDSEVIPLDLLIILEILAPIFPCQDCRQMLVKYSKKPGANLSGYLRIINSHILSEEETLQISLQKFQLGPRTRGLVSQKGANFFLTKKDQKSIKKHIRDVLKFNKEQNCNPRIRTRVQKITT